MPSPKEYLAHRTSALALSIMIAASTHTALLRAQIPVGQWKFDGGSGTTVTDSSGNGNTATLVNGVSWVAGQIGTAVSANAAKSQYIKIPAIDLSGTKAVTVTFWSNRAYTTNGGHIFLENTMNYNNSTTGFGFFPDDADCQGIQASVHGNVGYTAVCYKQPTSNVWHHFAVVYDKSKAGLNEVTLYIDGVLQAPTGSTFVSNNTNSFGKNPMYLFARAGTGQFDSGKLDELALYNTALTGAQVQQIYQPSTGAGTTCQLTAVPSSVSFSALTPGATSSYPASLINNCSTTVTVSSAKVSGAPYSLSGLTVPFSIAPGQTTNYTVIYSPATVGTATGNVTFTSNEASSPNFSVSLTGTAVAAQQGLLSSNPGSLIMGNVTVNTSQSQSVSITNTGTSAVTVSAVNIAGAGFTRSSLSTPFTLSAGQAVPLTVGFSPTTAGTIAGSITVSSNAQNSSLVVPVSGVGVASSVTLTWVGSGSQVAGYNVYRSNVANGSYTKLNSVPITVTNNADLTVVRGTTYYYAVTAVGTSGLESGYSNQAVATVP